MAESSLNIPMSQLLSQVGAWLGYGPGLDFGGAAWTARQARNARECLDSGLRMFYYPSEPYQWSFLRPTALLSLAEGETELDLPDDFGGLEGRLTLSADNSSWLPVQVGNEGFVREMLAREPGAAGKPVWAAVAPSRGLAAGRSSRATLVFFPQADRAYTVGARYYLLPQALTAAAPYAYGGAAHAETILAACRAAAERDFDDETSGPQASYFKERLAASIALDARNKAQSFGYNADRSDDWPDGADRRGNHAYSAVTFDGIQY